MPRDLLNDGLIRSALRRHVVARARRAPGTAVCEEFSLNRGETRVDLAVVNGHLTAYEIKSDRDTLARLAGQMRVYNRVFDRLTLVFGWRLAAQALRLVPSWWGVRLAEWGPRGAV